MNIQPTTLPAKIFAKQKLMRASNPQTIRGFTLVETMVAIFVLMIAIVAPMSIVSQALATARYAKDQVTAYYLAQEGIELVRNIRDNNTISGGTWNGGSLGSADSGTGCYSASGCRISPTDLGVQSCQNDGSACLPLYLNSSNIYSYDTGGTQTIFTRTIKISKATPSSVTEIKVSSTVSWYSSSFSDQKTFTIADTLFNWQ